MGLREEAHSDEQDSLERQRVHDQRSWRDRATPGITSAAEAERRTAAAEAAKAADAALRAWMTSGGVTMPPEGTQAHASAWDGASSLLRGMVGGAPVTVADLTACAVRSALYRACDLDGILVPQPLPTAAEAVAMLQRRAAAVRRPFVRSKLARLADELSRATPTVWSEDAACDVRNHLSALRGQE